MSEILKKINKRDDIIIRACAVQIEQLDFLRKYSDSESQVYNLAANYIEFAKEIKTMLLRPVEEVINE